MGFDDNRYLYRCWLCPGRRTFENIRSAASTALGESRAWRPVYDPWVTIRRNGDRSFLRQTTLRLGHLTSDYIFKKESNRLLVQQHTTRFHRSFLNCVSQFI